MDKLKMQSRDVYGNNVQKIAALFPQCVTERLDKDGKPELAIDFDKLRAELSNEVLDEGEERYQFTWPDKRAASRLANTPTTQTLRPCREESVDFDNTQNLYIEGDNLDVLKVLRETYLGKVKMIYIDPPYNTGNDFVYNDDFAQGKGDFEAQSGLFDDEGNQTIDPMQRNTESNGRFHTDWLNMIYPRLKVARDLLSDDGVIFISIDDNEIDNLRKICDEIFGAVCYVGTIIRATGTTTAQGTDSLGKSYDIILCFSKKESFVVGGIELSDKDKSRYTLEDDKGKFSILQLRRTGGEDRREDRPSMFYGIEAPDGSIIFPYGPTGYESRWRVGEDTFKKMLENGEIYFKQSENGYTVYYKFYLDGRTKRPSNLLTDIDGNKKAQIDLKSLIPEKVFDTPKPLELIERLAKIAKCKNSIVLDFFSGSATTAHAVMKLNAEDGGHRKFIMVQLPEVTDENSEARKAGYNNICEIGKERIRRAGKKIMESVGAQYFAPAATPDAENTPKSNSLFDVATDNSTQAQNIAPLQGNDANNTAQGNTLDIGFRVLKLDSSNMEDVYYTPDDFNANNLFTLADNIKTDRTSEDLLFQVMLDLGIELSAKIEKTEIAGKEVWCVDGSYLMACFDRDVNEATITEIAKQKPVYFVMRDASAANDNVLDNFDQLFANYSPDTTCKIL